MIATDQRRVVDFSFNSMGFSTNESMRQLALVTTVCLPLSVLTGFFGQVSQPRAPELYRRSLARPLQNFTDFPALNNSPL